MARDNCTNGFPQGNPAWEVIINNNRLQGKSVARVNDVYVNLYDKNLVKQLFPTNTFLKFLYLNFN